MNKPVRFCAVIEAPFGVIGLRTESGLIAEFVYLPPNYSLQTPESALAKKAIRQIETYFNDATFRFSLPLTPRGTAFQQKVWQAISSIPTGSVATYGQIARVIASAPRAVGQACGANYYPLIIPCHRVTAANALGGFANQDQEGSYHSQIKRWLLKYEGVDY